LKKKECFLTIKQGIKGGVFCIYPEEDYLMVILIEEVKYGIKL